MPEAAAGQAPVRLCAAEDLEEGGLGVRFSVALDQREIGAFVVRFDGAAHGYLNQCAHVPMELDWQEGRFFDASGLYLMCATHGAVYAPDSGECVGGPCRGASLAKLRIEERDGQVYWLPEAPYRIAARMGGA
ncbi:Ferredoxin subunit of nitrite reductase or a ring-hydroxylating dioxygenase [Cupriavidus necator]|uniref:Ferredoxin subunits of nitrite reductase or ring-hydroxylating dioxygenase n=1 Tax=Cupriavidus necator (strain ATCC 17699 / DSM 428 / KCTC 22496 / NCIMB 10442 / H16 / Stanier 337) TaxID=381666 RepID=Q0K8L2_CUPNH|nr:Rieske 2Fe-2S domain-containing protein [Cupriavidus necator]KUE85784.1 Rieske (2Fe-2S) protein [Cupriavidus necator]QCC01443.1 Rieske (2Fe-2S) protein [Cupriavidus necator H16]QQB75727.1 Rieske 2Fe-2S domain-containing protein [Cupriavidus necator]WKA39833.1 Rieske 2Fe-2S domain-containing protein [Cupriavidus necator]CAJ93659.1 ferredoxin subunits of nitrite reductase or ring-hydroxylating dioxygenase [Cupriavidus necator H16]